MSDFESAKSNLSVLIQKIQSWMSANKLKFNDDKTELIVFRKKKTKSATIDDITINNNVIQRSKSVRNLGFYLDEFSDMQSHISKLCQLIHYSLRNIGHVRNLIDDETCKMLVSIRLVLLGWSLDLCVIYGLSISSVYVQLWFLYFLAGIHRKGHDLKLFDARRSLQFFEDF